MTTPTDDSIIVQLIAQVKDQLQTVPALKGKVVQIFDEDELKDAMKGTNFPAVGVVYEGMRSAPEQGTMRQGVSTEAVFALVVLEKPTTAGESYVKVRTINLLDQVRKAMRAGRSPAGHQWRFLLEAPADGKKAGLVIWIQRWATPVQVP